MSPRLQMIRTLFGIIAAEVLATALALAVAQRWLLELVDDQCWYHSWYYRPGEKHEYVPVAEAPLLLAVEFLSVALAVWIALCVLRLRWSISRRAAACLAVPAGALAIALFDRVVSPLLPNPLAIFAHSIWPIIAVAVVVGALFLDRR